MCSSHPHDVQATFWATLVVAPGFKSSCRGVSLSGFFSSSFFFCAAWASGFLWTYFLSQISQGKRIACKHKESFLLALPVCAAHVSFWRAHVEYPRSLSLSLQACWLANHYKIRFKTIHVFCLLLSLSAQAAYRSVTDQTSAWRSRLGRRLIANWV